eukprot:3941383-Rhodomonas_salina.1
MLLRPCYAQRGTERAYGATSALATALPRYSSCPHVTPPPYGEIAYDAMRYAHMLLCAARTEFAYGTTPFWYCPSGTELAYGAPGAPTDPAPCAY